jgi:putative membrane protein
MGAADIVPGVSGGTVALILGIYERLVTAISRVDLHLFSLLRHRKWTDAARYIDLRFLLALGTGIGLGILSLASIIHTLLQDQMANTFGLFFGLILASAVIVIRMVERWTLTRGLLAAAGTLFAYSVTGMVPLEITPTPTYLFICGMVGICAMILPGISGSFLLLILGTYHHITGTLKAIVRGQAGLAEIETVILFSMGCLLGILSFSKILRRLLERARLATLSILCGFMLGSLRRIWPFKETLKNDQWINLWPEVSQATFIVFLFMFLGVVAVLLLDRISKKA